MTNRRTLGTKYEDMAISYLESNGYEIIDRNFSCKMGEIDIIALDSGYLVFVEVKYRSDSRFGSPLEAVDYRKQEKIRRSAMYYISTLHGTSYQKIRFDVVGILGQDITLIRNAFEA